MGRYGLDCPTCASRPRFVRARIAASLQPMPSWSKCIGLRHCPSSHCTVCVGVRVCCCRFCSRLFYPSSFLFFSFSLQIKRLTLKTLTKVFKRRVLSSREAHCVLMLSGGLTADQIMYVDETATDRSLQYRKIARSVLGERAFVVNHFDRGTRHAAYVKHPPPPTHTHTLTHPHTYIYIHIMRKSK